MLHKMISSHKHSSKPKLSAIVAEELARATGVDWRVKKSTVGNTVTVTFHPQKPVKIVPIQRVAASLYNWMNIPMETKRADCTYFEAIRRLGSDGVRLWFVEYLTNSTNQSLTPLRGEMLKNIGAHFGLSDSALVKASIRLEVRSSSEVTLRDKVDEILQSLGRVNVQT